MNTVLDTTKNTSKADAMAANADHVERMVVTPVTGSGTGWDAYDVWRRFIKDARDRREGRGAAGSR